jgi:sugar phosphate isomerase/epimerase
MLVGAVNNPARPVLEELERIAGEGLDFVDLTLEPPGAWPLDVAGVRAALDRHGLAAVGHTAWFLPVASPFVEIREAARSIFARGLEAFAAVGVELVNVHPDVRGLDFRPVAERVQRNVEAIVLLDADCRARGLRLMVENVGGPFGTAAELAPIFEAVPEAGFHLDIGHANLARGHGQGSALSELLEAFAGRLAHVHVHDNYGDSDRHLPPGAGAIDWDDAARQLRATGYDGTVTVEVFARPLELRLAAQQVWREAWQAAAAPSAVV